MAAMQCDVCGERLTMDLSGEYAICDYCGVKHPKARLMKKISEISGNVPAADKTQANESYTNAPVAEAAFTSGTFQEMKSQEDDMERKEPVQSASYEPEPVVKRPIPEPVVRQPIPEPVVKQPIPEPVVKQPTPEPVVSNDDDVLFGSMSDTSVMGAMDIGMEVGEGPVLTTPVQTETKNESQINLDNMTSAERAEYEKKAGRIKELNDELKEFEEIYEANKNKFLGEGLKRKNYSEIKIKEIKEKLEELEA